MAKTVIQFIWLFIVLVLVQSLFSKVLLFDVATPIVYVYLLLRLPIGTSMGIVYTIAFFLGLTVDVFNNTQGMNALACLLTALVRVPVFNAYVTRDDENSNIMPSIGALGIGAYLKYMGSMVLIFCSLIFFVQAFSLHNVLLTLARILASSVLSAVLIFGIESMMSVSKEERR